MSGWLRCLKCGRRLARVEIDPCRRATCLRMIKRGQVVFTLWEGDVTCKCGGVRIFKSVTIL